jgi:hypothetical protein
MVIRHQMAIRRQMVIHHRTEIRRQMNPITNCQGAW